MKRLISAAMLAVALVDGTALAAEWSPVKIEGNTVREIDLASVAKNGYVVKFVARHTFANPDEYKVSRNKVKYMLIHNRADCASRSLAQLATEAYDDKMLLLSKQQILLPQDLPVTRDSIDAAMLDFICNSGK